MPRLGKRSRAKRSFFRGKRTKRTKRTRYGTGSTTKVGSSRRGSTASMLSNMRRNRGLKGIPKRTGTKHWLSYGKTAKDRFRKPFIGKLARVLGKRMTNIFNSGDIKPAAGFQAVGLVADMFTPFDIYTYTYNANLGAVGAGNDKTILESCQTTTTFTNQTNTPTFVDIYDIVARRDIQVMGANSEFYDPAKCWTFGSGTVAGNVASTRLGTTPFMSTLFTQFWKVLRVTRLNLAAGETAEHRATHKPMRVWDHSIDYVVRNSIATDTTIQLTVDEGAFKNLTHYTMVVAMGAPGDPDTDSVGTLVSKLDWVTTKNYKYSSIENSASTLASDGVTNQTATHILDAVTGADETLHQA